MLGLSLNYRPKAIQTILDELKPTADQPEAIPYVLYDTQTYVAAGSSSLSFFTTLPNPADKTITNMPVAGVLPNPWYFEIQKVHFDVLNAVTTSATVAGGVNDIAILLGTGRGIATLQISDKNYGPFPLRYFGSAGSVVGNMALEGTAANANLQIGAVRDNGGFPVNGSLIIPPQAQFNWTLNWKATSAITADTLVTMQMLGVLYRRVS